MNRNCKILIAEDDSAGALAVRGQLLTLGYMSVQTVEDGPSAIEVARRGLADLVLMDIQLPGIDGLTAAHEIARDPGIPVIVVTSHDYPQYINQAVQRGVDNYLLKPVHGPALDAAIQVTLARFRERKSLREELHAMEAALRERKLIERAKGILMSRHHMNEPTAFRFLQRQSQNRRMPMARLAESIIQADELREALPDSTFS